MMIAAALTAIAAGVALLAVPRADPPTGPSATTAPATTTPANLLLLTSLPLVFSEKFEIEGNGSAVLARLEKSFAVEPIASTEAGLLARGKLLLMAHARAQPAEQLVELDAWVRAGGRVLLLADPALGWPSEKPLGDLTRPPPAFADTGLLKHWGLALVGPEPDGPAQRTIDGHQVLAAAPGRLTVAAGSGCTVADDGFVARCAVGKGEVTVIADADFLNVEGAAALDGPTDGNLDALVIALESLATR